MPRAHHLTSCNSGQNAIVGNGVLAIVPGFDLPLRQSENA